MHKLQFITAPLRYYYKVWFSYIIIVVSTKIFFFLNKINNHYININP
jgi:hypothetical protein